MQITALEQETLGRASEVHRANHGCRKTISIFYMQEQILLSVLDLFFSLFFFVDGYTKYCVIWGITILTIITPS